MGDETAEAQLWEDLRTEVGDDDPVPDEVITEAYRALEHGGTAETPEVPSQRRPEPEH